MFGTVPFIKNVGRGLGKIFKGREAEERLEREVDDLGLKRDGVRIEVGEAGRVKVAGRGLSQEDKEKLILAVGNVEGVGEVEDAVETEDNTPPARFYTVKSGDTLSKIAKDYYGDAMKYPEIFEANKPMLSDPDKIYPGQVLRIPPQAGDTEAGAAGSA